MKTALKHSLKNWAVYYFILWAIVSVFAPLIASEYSSDNNINSIIPYSPNTIDYENANAVSPFESQHVNSLYFRHWLGTDNLGRDVLTNLIHGSRTAFTIGFGVVLLAALIGILLGGISGYFGDKTIKIKQSNLYLLGILIPIYLLISSTLTPWNITEIAFIEKLTVFGGITLIFISIYILFSKLFFKNLTYKRYFPIDLIIGRLIEIVDAIPLLFLLVCLSVLIESSYFSTVFIIALVAWPSIAKYTRAEVIKIKNETYIESSKALGLSDLKIIRKHILPNSLGPVLVSLSFGVAAAILIEASLSFLGMGISSEQASWGKLIAEARNQYDAWWLAIFPGMAIFLTVLASRKLSKLLEENN